MSHRTTILCGSWSFPRMDISQVYFLPKRTIPERRILKTNSGKDTSAIIHIFRMGIWVTRLEIHCRLSKVCGAPYSQPKM